MKSTVVHVEIEFSHDDCVDGEVVLRRGLEDMLAAMRDRATEISDAHYHIVKRHPVTGA